MKKIALIFLSAHSLSATTITPTSITWTTSGTITGDTSEIISSTDGVLLFDQTEFTRDLYTGTTTGDAVLLTDGSSFSATDYSSALDYAHNFSASGEEMLYFGGLTAGTDYTIQLFSVDLRSAVTEDRTLVVNGDYIIESGDYATGTFTADSEYVSIQFYGSSLSDPTATNNHVLNLVAITGDVDNIVSSSGLPEEALPAIGVSVPEPTAFALLGLGGLALITRRQR